MEYDVFIGYSRKDSGVAEIIENYLSKCGFKCWRDKTLIPGSDEWVEAITKAIDSCHVYVAIVSNYSVLSKYVAREIMMADSAGKSFLPVILSDNVKLSPRMRFLFSELQHIYALPTLDAVLPDLADAVSRAVDRNKHKDAYDDEASIIERSDYHYHLRLEADIKSLHLGESESGITTIEEGAYVMEPKPEHYLNQGLDIPSRMGDFIIETTVCKIVGPDHQWFGLEFGDNHPGNYYQFLLHGYGGLRIAKYLNGTWSDLAFYEGLRQIKAGNFKNILKVVRKGELFQIYVNHLYVTTLIDHDIRLGNFRLIVGKGLRIAFRDLRIEGITLDSVYQEALNHWEKLEIKEARTLFKKLADSDPSNKRATRLLQEFHPDYRESILIVIGYKLLPQIHDGISAFRLKGEINTRGRPHELRFASIVTDKGLLEDQKYMKCPLIVIGGPESNSITNIISEDLLLDPISTEHSFIYHNMEETIKKVALWGTGSIETAEAVKSFIYDRLLDRFLEIIWGEKRTKIDWGSSSP